MNGAELLEQIRLFIKMYDDGDTDIEEVRWEVNGMKMLYGFIKGKINDRLNEMAKDYYHGD